MTEESELMVILKRRKQLTDLSDVDDSCDINSSEEQQNKNVRCNEGEHVYDNDPDIVQDYSINLRRSAISSLYGRPTQFNRDSHSSLNSRLSALSGSLQSSFSSNSDTSEIFCKKNAVKLRAKDSILINSCRRRKKFLPRNSSTPDDASPNPNRSFLWSRGVSIEDKLHKSNSTASFDSNCSDELIYYSIGDTEEKSCEASSNSLENVHTFEYERDRIEEADVTTDDNIYESVEGINNLKINENVEVSDTNNNDTPNGILEDEQIYYGSDSNDFGYEHFDNFNSTKKLVSAINKNVKNVQVYSAGLPEFFDNEDKSEQSVVDDEKYDTATIASDDYGSEHYEDVESGLKVINTINECFQNEGLIFRGVPNDIQSDKFERRLRGRVNELVQTEINYVTKLDHVVDDYKAVLRGDGIPPPLESLLPDQIFSNIEDLRDFHKEIFLPALQEADHDLVAIGRVFKDYEIQFKMYIKYSRDNKKCIRNVIEHKQFFQIRQTELDQRLDLSCFLLEPIQRVPRYRLFLDDLIKTCKKRDEEMREDSGIGIGCRTSIASFGSSTFYETMNFEEEPPPVMKEETSLESLQDAKNMIDKLLRKIDDTVAIENIKGCPASLRDQGDLLRQDEFIVLDHSRRRFQMRCFLFESAVIFTIISKKHVKEEVFEYHDYIGMKDLGITPPPEDECLSTFTVWYKKRNNKPYIMDGDVNVKKAWVRDLSALLWEQARRDKEKLISTRKSSTVARPRRMSKEPSPTDSEFVMVYPEPLPSISSRMAGDQCTSSRTKITKRKLRKKKVNTDIPDTLTFIGRNIHVIWSSLR